MSIVLSSARIETPPHRPPAPHPAGMTNSRAERPTLVARSADHDWKGKRRHGGYAEHRYDRSQGVRVLAANARTVPGVGRHGGVRRRDAPDAGRIPRDDGLRRDLRPG